MHGQRRQAKAAKQLEQFGWRLQKGVGGRTSASDGRDQRVRSHAKACCRGHCRVDRTMRGVEKKARLPKESRASSTRGPSSASQAVGVAGQALPPRLQVLLLGTAGTGKTHTAKIGITEA